MTDRPTTGRKPSGIKLKSERIQTPQPGGATLQQAELARSRLAEAGFSAFSEIFLQCFSAQEAEALESAGRALFTRAARKRLPHEARRGASQARRRSTGIIHELEILAAALDRGTEARERFAQEDFETAYYEHASALLAADLQGLLQASVLSHRPSPDELEVFRDAFPRDPAAYSCRRALVALRLAERSLQAAVDRHEWLLAAREVPGRLAIWLAVSLALRKALDGHVRPALEEVEELTIPAEMPPEAGWAVGPWQALQFAHRQARDLAGRLLAAYESMAEEELRTEAGAGLALALHQVINTLQGAALEAVRGSEQTAGPALAALDPAARLSLRLIGMARQAEGWAAELRDYVLLLETASAEAQDDPAQAAVIALLQAWLGEVAEGVLAEVGSTLQRLAAEVPAGESC